MKKIMMITLTVLLLITLVSCEKDPIKIGYIGNLSSKTSQLAVDARNGIEIRIKQINDAGGINGAQLQLIVKDDGADLEQAIEMHQEFKDEGVKFVVGHVTSDMASVVSASQSEDLLFMSPSMSTDSLSGMDDYFLRTAPINSRQGDIISRYFHEKEIKNVSVIYDLSNQEYTENLYNAFKNYYLKDGYSINHTIAYDSRTDDIESITNDLIDLKSDNIFLITQATDTAYFIQRLKLDNQNINAYSVSWSMTSDLLANGGAAVENTIFIGIHLPEEITESYKKFDEDFQEAFNVAPSFISVLAYDALEVLLEGIKQADDFSPKSVKEKIIEIGSFDALRVTFTMDEYGDNDRMYMLYQLRDGKFVPLRDWQ